MHNLLQQLLPDRVYAHMCAAEERVPRVARCRTHLMVAGDTALAEQPAASRSSLTRHGADEQRHVALHEVLRQRAEVRHCVLQRQRTVVMAARRLTTQAQVQQAQADVTRAPR